MRLRIAMFYHSLVSDWNHGNAHFLRGVAAELRTRGHDLRIFEPQDSWSRMNLLEEAGPAAIEEFHRAFPQLQSTPYRTDDLRVSEWLDGADLVIVHEWSDPGLVAAVGRYRRSHNNARLLFHDTHHRAVTAAEELARFDLSEYDGVLAYGASLKDAYAKHGWGKQVHVWHEAADTRVFYPRSDYTPSGDVVWIGNWGDDERSDEIREFFIRPVANRHWTAQVRGVRYPESAHQELRTAGISYSGWIPNFQVPELFAQYRATVHVPRRPYTLQLPGIPTIRPFEALACGIPLVSAPWNDTEGLFRVGRDFLMARNGQQMEGYLRDVIHDRDLASELASAGLETIRDRHTCAHRVDQLLSIYEDMRPVPSHEETACSSKALL
jgi:spore maturation protein CgeB